MRQISQLDAQLYYAEEQMHRKSRTFIISACLFLLAPLALRAQWVGNNVPLSIQVFSIYTNGNNVFVGSDSAVYLSTNGGVSFTHPANSGMQSKQVVYAFAAKDSFVFAGTSSNGVFRSSDLGTNWHAMSAGIPTGLEVYSMIVTDSAVFAGTNDGVYRSTNDGTSWQAVNSGMANTSVYTLATVSDGVGGTFILAGTVRGIPPANGGVFRSSDLGSSWQAVNGGLTDSSVYVLAVNPASNIFAATSGQGVFRSTNLGMSWQAVNSGLGSLNVVSLAAGNNGLTDSTVFAGIFGFSGGGTYASTNGGSNWGALGLAGKSINALAVNSTYVFAGIASGGGVYRRARTVSSSVGHDQGHAPFQFALDQNYPSPFNPATQIGYELVAETRVSLKVYNTFGQEVGDLVEKVQPAGFHAVVFDAGALSSGMYFYRLQAGTYASVKKMMLLK